jgi:hypothetical protein
MVTMHVQADVGPAAASCQAVPGVQLPRAAVPRVAQRPHAASRASGGPAPQRVPKHVAQAAARAAGQIIATLGFCARVWRAN